MSKAEIKESISAPEVAEQKVVTFGTEEVPLKPSPNARKRSRSEEELDQFQDNKIVDTTPRDRGSIDVSKMFGEDPDSLADELGAIDFGSSQNSSRASSPVKKFKTSYVTR